MKLSEVVKQLGISEEYLIPYGGYTYKVDLGALGEQKGKLVLVTSINPTPAGEGKTTTAIGLADALAASGKKAVVTLREPSLGPVFGVKGGATGGGKAHVVIMAETGWVHSKAMDLSSDIGTDDLAYIELVLNRYFQGLTFKQITRTVLNAVYNELIKYRKTINNILEIMEVVLQEEMKDNLYLGGTNRILKQPEYSDIEEVRNLMNFIEKEENLRMILQDADPYKVTVKIGEEIKSEQASKYSAVTAVYKLGGNIMGVLGLLGPMRMDYARAMTVVEHMTNALSEALSEEKFF